MADEKKIALVDLDGTIADYDRALRNAMRVLQAPGEPPYDGRLEDSFELPHLKARRKLIQAQPGFWRDLPQHSIGFQVIDELRAIGFQLHILTKGPATTPIAWSEKLEWAREHLPGVPITISSDKSLVYGRVLVDDYGPYFLPWLEHRPRGLVIAVAQPWNADIKHSNLIRYDGSNREQLREALQKAFDR